MISSTNLKQWLSLSHVGEKSRTPFQNYLRNDPALTNIPKNLKINWAGVARDLHWLETTPKAAIITYQDPNYPPLLKRVPDAPPVIYALGNTECLQKDALAIIGTKNCTVRGARMAGGFAKNISQLGMTVISGLSPGIERSAHIGALDTAATIACLAHGLDMVYPAQHRRLAQQIAANGCLLSEFPIGSIPLPENFPRRNRLLSGMCLGLLIVEAYRHSGSLITARYAIDHGREVFAVPGPIDLRQVGGCHQLIKQGAKLVESLDDIIEELEALLNRDIRDKYAGYIKTRTKRGHPA